MGCSRQGAGDRSSKWRPAEIYRSGCRFQKVSATFQAPKGLDRSGRQNLRTAIQGLSTDSI